MNSELASNDIRQAIDEAVGRYYNNPIRQGATHVDGWGDHFKKVRDIWYRLCPFDGWVKARKFEVLYGDFREL